VTHSDQNVASLKQGDLPIIKYFTKIQMIWDELDNLSLDPVCVQSQIFLWCSC